MNVSIGATWVAGTKTYTLKDIWLHYENGQWEPWVYIEVKWKVRTQHGNKPWRVWEAELRREGAVIQEGPSVVRWERV